MILCETHYGDQVRADRENNTEVSTVCCLCGFAADKDLWIMPTHCDVCADLAAKNATSGANEKVKMTPTGGVLQLAEDYAHLRIQCTDATPADLIDMLYLLHRYHPKDNTGEPLSSMKS